MCSAVMMVKAIATATAWEPATADEIALQLETLGRAHHWPREMGAVLCSVVPALTLPWATALERRSGRPPVEVNAATAKSLPVRYHDPSAVGADRIANAIAARALYGTPAIVVDLGTATTFDCISRQGAYLGGAIASYVRIGDMYPPLLPLTTAMLAWLGIWLRDKRLRELLPLRTSPKRTARQ